jgi:hypothetical protein
MRKHVVLLSFIAVLIISAFTIRINKMENPGNEKAEGFAVVELFTSEGCSSCPAADEAVIRLAKEFPDHVYILGYHIDYWNYIGWKDEFSQSSFSSRQTKYGQQFGLNSIYTPQAIVNGGKEFVGSNRSLLISTVEKELSVKPKYTMELTAKTDGTDKINVNYKTDTKEDDNLNIALVQLNAATQVKRGENKGRLLHHINIVRELKTITDKKEGTISISIPENLTAKDVKLIAFLQNKNDWKITAATDAVVQ